MLLLIACTVETVDTAWSGGRIDPSMGDDVPPPVDDDGDGSSEAEQDCDDADAAIGPHAEEVPGDGVDQDCDHSDAPSVRLADVGEAWWGEPGSVLGGVLLVAPVDDVPGDDVVATAWGHDETLLLGDGGAIASWLGWGALAAGDVDGDGRSDLVMGETRSDVAGPSAGAVWAWTGPVAGAMDPADAGVRVEGAPYQGLGGTACAGDWDGDGRADLVAMDGGSDLQVWWDAGATPGARIDVDYEWGGACASGDLDGDGREDLVLAGYVDGAVNEGLVGVYTTPPTADASLWDAPALLYGEEPHSSFGVALAVGDTDGDGRADLVVGAPGLDHDAEDKGAVYVFRAVPVGSVEASTADLRVLAEEEEVGLGRTVAVAQAGGEAWIAAGAAYVMPDNVYRHARSEVFVFGAGGSGDQTTAQSGAVFWDGVRALNPPVGAGDLDGDGAGELVIASPEGGDSAVWRVALDF